MLVFFVTQINYNIQGDQKIPGFFFYYLNIQIIFQILISFKVFTARCYTLVPSHMPFFEVVLKVFNFKLFE